MKITVITVGKMKEKYLKDAIAEYSKRLSKYCKLEVVEVPDEKTPDNASEVVEDMIRTKEAERLLKHIKDDAFVITLEINGKQLSSEELADKIDKLGVQGTSHIIFIIGGSIGLGQEVLQKSNFLYYVLILHLLSPNMDKYESLFPEVPDRQDVQSLVHFHLAATQCI